MFLECNAGKVHTTEADGDADARRVIGLINCTRMP